MLKESKIFLAGSNGMIGSAIKQRLISDGYSNLLCPNSKEVDLMNQAETESFFKENEPEYVFLAAAKVGGVFASNVYKAEFIYRNLMISTNVIHYSYKYNVKKLMNLVPSCVYPHDAKQPIKENAMLSGHLEATTEAYAVAKIASIKLCTTYNYQYKTDFISLIPTNVFGLNDNFNLETSHLIPAIIRKTILAKALMEGNFELIAKDIKLRELGFGLDGKVYADNKISIINALRSIGIFADEIEFWGSGVPKREFMCSDDLAAACLYFANNVSVKEAGDFINVGSGRELSVKEVINIVSKIIGYTGKIDFNSIKPDGALRRLLDSGKANHLGWKSQFEFEDSLKKVINNYLETLS